MIRERILQTEQVGEFRALGEQLQRRIELLVQAGDKVPGSLVERYRTILHNNQTVFDNLSRMTNAAVALNQFLERMLGMSVEGCLLTMGERKETLTTGMWAALALANQRVRCAIKNSDALIAELEKQRQKDTCDEN